MSVLKNVYPNLPEFIVLGENVVIKHGVTLGNFITLHDNVFIDKGSYVGNYCDLEEGTEIGKNCTIQGGVRSGPYAHVKNDVVIKYGTILTNHAVVSNRTFIGPNVITLGGDYDKERIDGTTIGEDCYIGAGTKIAVGINICNGVVIGANSFVNKNIIKPGIYAGSPVRLIRGFNE